MFPENLVQACFQYVETYYENKTNAIIPPNVTESGVTQSLTTVADIETHEIVKKLHYKNGTNVMGAF